MQVLALARQEGKTKVAVETYLNLMENNVPAIIVVPMGQDAKIVHHRVCEEAYDRKRKSKYYFIGNDPREPMDVTIKRDIIPSEEYFKRVGMGNPYKNVRVIFDDMERFPRFSNVTLITTTPIRHIEQPWKERS